MREAVVRINTRVDYHDRDAGYDGPCELLEVKLRPAQMIADADGSSLGLLYGRVQITDEGLAHPTFPRNAEAEVDGLMHDLEPWFIELKAAIRAALVEAVLA